MDIGKFDLVDVAKRGFLVVVLDIFNVFTFYLSSYFIQLCVSFLVLISRCDGYFFVPFLYTDILIVKYQAKRA